MLFLLFVTILVVTACLVQVIHVSWIKFGELSFLSNVIWISSKWLIAIGSARPFFKPGSTGNTADDRHWFRCWTLHEPNQMNKFLKCSIQKSTFFPFELSLARIKIAAGLKCRSLFTGQSTGHHDKWTALKLSPNPNLLTKCSIRSRGICVVW